MPFWIVDSKADKSVCSVVIRSTVVDDMVG